jgi:hypothetical protein
MMLFFHPGRIAGWRVAGLAFYIEMAQLAGSAAHGVGERGKVEWRGWCASGVEGLHMIPVGGRKKS